MFESPEPEKGGAAPAPEIEPEGEFVEDVLDDEEEQAPDDGSPKPPAPAGQPAAPAAPAATPGEQGQPRDERGQFVEQSKGEPAPSGPAATAAPAAEPEKPAAAPERFTFRAGAQDYEIAGATFAPDGGLVIPKASLEDLSKTLSLGVHHQTTWAGERERLVRQVDEAKRQGTFDVEQAKSIMDQLEARVESHLGAIDEEGRAELAALAARYPKSQLLTFLADTVTDWPRLKLEAEKKALEAERRAMHASHEPAQRAELERQLDQALDVHVDEVAREFPGVDPKRVAAYLRSQGVREYFMRLDRDQDGLRKGEVVVKLGRIRAAFTLVAEAQQQARAAEAAAKKVDGDNKKAVAASGAPAAVAAAGAAAPGAKDEDEIPVFKTKAERDAWQAARFKKAASGA